MHRHKMLNRGFFLKVTRRHSFALLHMDPKPVQVLFFIASYVRNLSRQCLNFIPTRDRETHLRVKFKDGSVGINLLMDDQEVLRLLRALFGERHLSKCITAVCVECTRECRCVYLRLCL